MTTITMGPGRPGRWLHQLAEPAGLKPVDDPAEADALVWIDPHDTEGLAAALAAGPGIRWVQLPSAGVDKIVEAGLIRPGDGRVWTGAQGAYREPVAELALALLLAGLRHVGEYACASSWADRAGTTLYDARVTIVGAGGIAQELLRLLAPFRVQATLVRRQAEPGAGGAGDPLGRGLDSGSNGSGGSGDRADGPAPARVVGVADLHEALADADAVVLALALTPSTVGIIAEPELRAMADDAWLVNIARGPHIVTDDLVRALDEGWIGGAALDVTDPEPLPEGHPLWRAPNCIITPHTACTPDMAVPRLGARIAENMRRFAAGEELLGRVDAEHGY